MHDRDAFYRRIGLGILGLILALALYYISWPLFLRDMEYVFG